MPDVTTHRPKLSREDAAKLEISLTAVSRPTAAGIVAVFLVLIAAPGAIESMTAWRSGRAAPAWLRAAALPRELRASVEDRAGMLERIRAGNGTVLAALHGVEDDLADSPVPAAVRPPLQAALSGWLRVGNERVYQGRDAWLFYRPDVDYVIGSGFLDPGTMRRRQTSASEWITQPQPDPARALVHFNDQLARRGVTLIVMPTPVKPIMRPDKLAIADARWAVPVQNPSYEAFLERLRLRNVLVFDLGAALAEGMDPALYLAGDTHWRPETMERAADLLGAFIRAHVSLPDIGTPAYELEVREVANVGDTAIMLDLPSGHRLTQPETVVVHRVLDGAGAPWRPSRDADVLLLGDSFSNVYSLASMGWGDGGGLVEHLSRALGRPIDRIVQNDNGAYATRARLRQELASGSDRLAGKAVVVLQFAARELAAGDWQLIDLPKADRAGP